MKDGAWVVVLKPSFVNGIDPIMKGAVGYNRNLKGGGGVVASDLAGVGGAASEHYVYGKDDFKLVPIDRMNLPLLGYPMMALDFNSGNGWPGLKPTPQAIQNLGVIVDSSGGNGDITISVDSSGNVTASPKPNTGNPIPSTYRIAKTIDVVLGQAREILNQNLTITGNPTTGTIINYSTAYDLTSIEANGFRPFVYQVPSWDDVNARMQAFAGNTWAKIFTGDTVADDGIDKQWLFRAWAISPEIPIGTNKVPPVDSSWTLKFQYKAFTNLAYSAKRPALYNVPSSTPFYTGLAAGIGDLIINSYLSLQNNLTDQLTQAYFNQTPIGKFWSVA